jgi:hypothetical protein
MGRQHFCLRPALATAETTATGQAGKRWGEAGLFTAIIVAGWANYVLTVSLVKKITNLNLPGFRGADNLK